MSQPSAIALLLGAIGFFCAPVLICWPLVSPILIASAAIALLAITGTPDALQALFGLLDGGLLTLPATAIPEILKGFILGTAFSAGLIVIRLFARWSALQLGSASPRSTPESSPLEPVLAAFALLVVLEIPLSDRIIAAVVAELHAPIDSRLLTVGLAKTFASALILALPIFGCGIAFDLAHGFLSRRLQSYRLAAGPSLRFFVLHLCALLGVFVLSSALASAFLASAPALGPIP